MNVLLFVTSLLLVLSLLTYARIDNFRYFLGMQSGFERYMQSLERSYTNKSAENWYDLTIANSRSPKPEEPKPPKTEDATPKPSGGAASSRLSLRILLDPEMRASNPEAYHQTLQWTKDLMRALYGHQRFFIEMQEKRPTFLDDILNGMAEAIQAIPLQKRKWNNTAELSNIALDPELEDAYYLMLKGCIKEENPPSELNQATPQEFTISLEANREDEEDYANEATEYSGAYGYSSLLNYVTLRNATKVRVFLASRELLTAIFGQTSVAEAIIQTRHNLYLLVRNGKMTADDATNQFQAAYRTAARGNADAFLDFKITKTDPSRYD